MFLRMYEEELSDFEDMGEDNSKSDLELIREKNIRELQAMLSSVKNKIKEANEEFTLLGECPDKNLQKSEKKRRQKPKDSSFRTSAIIPSERRRSQRLAGSAPNYKDLDLDEFEENESDLRKKFQYRKRMYNDSDDNLETVYRPATQRTKTRRVSPPPYIHPDEITEEDIANISQTYADEVKSRFGTSCHQCRQKTTSTKTICRSGYCIGVRGQFCGVCLRIRYGENAEEALKDPKWACPPCRDTCNCSICRKRKGKRPTGIIAPVANEKGFKSVKDFLGSLKGRGDFPDQDGIYEENALDVEIEDFKGFSKKKVSYLPLSLLEEIILNLTRDITQLKLSSVQLEDFPDQDGIYEDQNTLDVEIEDFRGFSNKKVSYLPLSLLEESILNLTRDITQLELWPIRLEVSLDKTIIKNYLLDTQKQRKRNSNPIKSKVKKMQELKIIDETHENHTSKNEIKNVNKKRKRSKFDTSPNKLLKNKDFDPVDESLAAKMAFGQLYLTVNKAQYVCSCGIDNQRTFVEENEDFQGF